MSMSRNLARSLPAAAGGCWADGQASTTPTPINPVGFFASLVIPLRGYHFLHSAIDAHSRLAYSELLTDERKDTAAAFWLRANTWFAQCGITVRKVLTDNGSCYRSHDFRDALGDIEHRRTRPYRPQTNGKVERFHRTLADEWAYARLYTSDAERCDEFPIWLHTYNHHRGHTALGGQPPATRVPNLSGQYT
jgi:transposase InsO family protein